MEQELHGIWEGYPCLRSCEGPRQGGGGDFHDSSQREEARMAADEKPDSDVAREESFSAEELNSIHKIIARHKSRPGSLIPVLEEIQEAVGYLPRTVLNTVGLNLRLPLSEVYGVVTFYSFFTMLPRGRHTIRCCLGTACYVRGGRKNLEKLIETLKIGPGETTRDRRFSLETVRCLGACGLAPVMTVDEDTYRQIKPAEIPKILESYV